MASTLGIFAKYWQPGKVKTRLAADLGNESAARIYKMFIETLIRRMTKVADRRILAYSPPERIEEFAALCDSKWQLDSQSQGDLGFRMKSFLQAAFAHGADRVVLIGSDSPTLPVKYVELAFKLLQENQVVLGPTLDGGYYLVGVAGTIPPIFSGISWSSTKVWEQTLTILREKNFQLGILPEWYDVDQIDDMKKLQEELARLVSKDSSWAALLQETDRCLSS